MTLAGVFAPQAGHAAVVFWGTPATISADTDVSTTGAALYAYTGGTAGTVNGVAFTAGTGFAAWGNVKFASGFTGSTVSAYAVNAAPFNGLSLTYSNLLAGGAYGGASVGTVTLNGLTPNRTYAVQIWVNDSRANSHYETATNTVASASTAPQLLYNTYFAPGGVGQYVIGFFVADNTSNSFALIPSPAGSVQLNAISVRDIGSASKVWLGSSDTSWGTGANWSPAGVLIAGQSPVFNNLSTTNNSILDVNYTVASVTVSNASGPVSIGGAPNVLTLSSASGIDLVGSSQSLTITAPIVLGANQYWTLTNNSSVVASGGISGSGSFALNGGFGVTNNGGTVTFVGPQTFTGNCDVNSGTLALSGAATLATPSLRVNNGSTLDVSAVSPTFTLGASQALTSFGSLGSVLNGSMDASVGTLQLRCDGVTPNFYLTNGALTLSASTVLSIYNVGSVLPAGTYNIIQAATSGNPGSVTGILPAFTFSGNGAVGAASLQLVGGNLQLVVAPADVWTGASDTSWANTGNWSPTTVPINGDFVLFNGSSTANLATVLNQDFALSGITVLNPAGPVSIGGANNLGVSANGINLSEATQNLTVSSPLQALANQTWNITNARTLTISGAVTGSGNLTLTRGGTVQLGAAHVLDGLTNNVLAAGGITINNTLDMNGTAQAINGLNGSGVVNNTAVGTATLTVGGNGANGAFSGIIENTGGGALGLEVIGGSLGLNTSTNTYTGGITVDAGGLLSFPSGAYSIGTGPVTLHPGGGFAGGNLTFTNALTLDGGYLRTGGGNNNVMTWNGPVTVTANGFSMTEDTGSGGPKLASPFSISGGITITNSGSGGLGGYGTGASTLAGVISGSGGLTYYGNGALSRLTLTGTNTYTGGTVVNGGSGKINVSGDPYAFSTGPVTLNAGGVIESYPGYTTITNALTLNGGTLYGESQYNNYNALIWAGPVTLTADSMLFQWGAKYNQMSQGAWLNGPVNVNGFTLTGNGVTGIYSGNKINGPISGTGTILVTNNALYVQGTNTFSGTLRAASGTLILNNVYAATNATLDMNVADAGTVTFINNAIIGALIGSRTIALGTNTLQVGYNGASTLYEGVLSGAGSLNKIGTGTLTLDNAGTYTGSTAINGGTLLVANTSGSGTGTGAVNINSGGTLGGTGTISGLVTNNAGGVLSPGAGGVGMLSLNGNVTLLSGSINTFVVNGSTSANNSVVVGAAVTYGGGLDIIANGSFTVGQQFILFSGPGATNTSNFATLVGSPGTGKAFSFTNGVLSVVGSVLSNPVINSVALSGGNLILQGTNGAPSGTYAILTSTNLALPLSNWTTNSTGTFTASGAFSNAIPVTSQTQQFFDIKQP